jgi:predicted transcriptional regulator
MAIRAEDIVPIAEAVSRLRELADAATHGTRTILTDDNGNELVAIVDVHRLQQLEQLESSVPSPFTASDVRRGVEDIEAGRMFSAEEHDAFMDEMQSNIEKRADELLKARNGDS